MRKLYLNEKQNALFLIIEALLKFKHKNREDQKFPSFRVLVKKLQASEGARVDGPRGNY